MDYSRNSQQNRLATQRERERYYAAALHCPEPYATCISCAL